MSNTGTSKLKSALWYRERLLRRGETIRSWAIAHDYAPVTVHYAIHGWRKGPISREIIQKLEEWINE